MNDDTETTVADRLGEQLPTPDAGPPDSISFRPPPAARPLPVRPKAATPDP